MSNRTPSLPAPLDSPWQLMELLSDVLDPLNSYHHTAVDRLVSNPNYVNMVRANPNFATGEHDPDIRYRGLSGLDPIFFVRLADIYSPEQKLAIVDYVWAKAIRFSLDNLLFDFKIDQERVSPPPPSAYEHLTLRGFMEFVRRFTHDKRQVQWWIQYIINLAETEFNNYLTDLKAEDKPNQEDVDVWTADRDKIIPWLSNYLIV